MRSKNCLDGCISVEDWGREYWSSEMTKWRIGLDRGGELLKIPRTRLGNTVRHVKSGNDNGDGDDSRNITPLSPSFL